MKHAATLLYAFTLSLAACNGGPADEMAAPAAPPAVIDNEPSIQLYIDGAEYQFQPYGFCGNRDDGSPHAIGIRMDFDNRPVQEHTPLQITGSRENNPEIGVVPFTKIDFRFQNHHAIVYLKGDETLAFENGVFEWSGETPGNQQLSVKVVCS